MGDQIRFKLTDGTIWFINGAYDAIVGDTVTVQVEGTIDFKIGVVSEILD
jgi:hypothetical protein